tara:strand:- start:995 stop:1249 length:255 start_codon:yes stop_codon:yes gene_type:complete
MELVEYCFENFKKILGISILVQVGLATFILMNSFTQKNAERLFMLFLGIGLPTWASIFFGGLITEIIFFIITGFVCFKLGIEFK